MTSQKPDKAEKLGPNNGRGIAVCGLVLGVFALVMILQDGTASGNLAAAGTSLLVMALIWAVLLRPAVFLDHTTLRLRNAFADIVIPLASVDGVVIRQVLVVNTEDRRLHSTALTRRRRELTKRDRGGSGPDPLNNYADFVEERINSRSDDARARGEAAGEPRRRPAWPEIVVVAALVVAVLILAFA